MRFSIITICYNPGPELKTSIESVLSQHDADIEYILVDGGSTDGTVELVKSYGHKIATFISEPDKGLYDALNKGVKRATGDCVGFVHADDFYPSNDVISTLAKGFEDGADAVYGDKIYVSKSDTDKMIRYWSAGMYDKKKLKYGWMPPHLSFYLKREHYEAVQLEPGVYFDPSFKISADYDFMMRVLSRLDITIKYIPIPIIKMRTGGTSNKSIKNLIIKSKEDYLAMTRNQIGGWYTLLFKNLQKLPQFFKKGR